MVQRQPSLTVKTANRPDWVLEKGTRVIFQHGSPDDGVPPGSRGTVSSISVDDDITVYISPDSRPAIRLGFLDDEVGHELTPVHVNGVANHDELVCYPVG